MACFQAGQPNGVAVPPRAVLVRTASFPPANRLGGHRLQGAADRLAAAYQPKPGQPRKGRESIRVHGLGGAVKLEGEDYSHEGKSRAIIRPRRRGDWKGAPLRL